MEIRLIRPFQIIMDFAVACNTFSIVKSDGVI